MLKEIKEFKKYNVFQSVINGELCVTFELTEPKNIPSMWGHVTESTVVFTEEELEKRIKTLLDEGSECLISNQALDTLKRKKSSNKKPIMY